MTPGRKIVSLSHTHWSLGRNAGAHERRAHHPPLSFALSRSLSRPPTPPPPHSPKRECVCGRRHLPCKPYTLHPTPYTLHPTPYTLHPTPCTLHSTPNTRHLSLGHSARSHEGRAHHLPHVRGTIARLLVEGLGCKVEGSRFKVKGSRF